MKNSSNNSNGQNRQSTSIFIQSLQSGSPNHQKHQITRQKSGTNTHKHR